MSIPLLRFHCARVGRKCPFKNDEVEIELNSGSCVHLKGNSGSGKSTLATHIAGLSPSSALSNLDINVISCEWRNDIPIGERAGMLFQHTTLLDGLTVAGNVCVALESSTNDSAMSAEKRNQRIKELIEAVGLDYARDAGKYPSELSGGMARRASLALQLAQRKRVIVLDEPFTGLDPGAGASISRELLRMRREHGTALLLISHEADYASMVMGDPEKLHNAEVTLRQTSINTDLNQLSRRRVLLGVNAKERFLWKLIDYLFWSLPLILMTFTASGLAISILSANVLDRVDVTDQVIEIVDKEVRPMLSMVTGEESNPMLLMMVKMKVRAMINTAIPKAKASLYALGLAKLFVLEIGPLLTGLLLCGRIGGSYAGEVATMKATMQNSLLKTLGVNPQAWTLLPAFGGAIIAAPLLTIAGTVLALYLGGVVGAHYGIITEEQYGREILESVFPLLRIRPNVWDSDGRAGLWVNLRTSFSDSYADALIELATYPPIFLFLKATSFIAVILTIAEAVSRYRGLLTPRHVPSVITTSVVLAGLLIIVCDWGFSQLLLLRH